MVGFWLLLFFYFWNMRIIRVRRCGKGHLGFDLDSIPEDIERGHREEIQKWVGKVNQLFLLCSNRQK